MVRHNGTVGRVVVGFLVGTADGLLVGVLDCAADGLVVGLVDDDHAVGIFAEGAADGKRDF